MEAILGFEFCGFPVFWCLYLAVNAVTFGAYAVDKVLAVYNKQRIRERTLITMTMMFSGLGALLAMMVCRHKIRKIKFWFFAVLSIVFQIGVILLLDL